ncbi:MAG: choline-sulfatase [Pseudomonadota bacterium]
MSQPNILVIQADQLNPSFLSAYGNPVANTPHIDRVAAQGTVFESAYCNFPLCAPSRFSMMSGMLPSNVGAYDNGAEFQSSVPTIAHYMRSLGYQTCLSGKMHFVGADQLHGFERRLTGDIYPADFNWTGDWSEVRTKFGNDKITFSGSGVCTYNAQMAYDDETMHRARSELYRIAQGKDERPFFLFTSFTHPHDPYQCTQAYWDRYRHEDIDAPRVSRIADSDNDPYSLRLLTQYGLKDYEPTDEETLTARHAYYGSVSFFDDKVGALLDTLEHTNLLDNTAILITSDHGDMMGERGLWYKKSFFEDSCRIPMIVGGMKLNEQRRSQNVSLVDLLPTLIEASGASASETLIEDSDGRSLWSTVSDNATLDEVPMFGENLAEGANAPILMTKLGQWKYIKSGVDPEQLFDLGTDPDELQNLASDPNNVNKLKAMRELSNQQWDLESLTAKVRASQKRRLFLREVLKIGARDPWDYTPNDPVSEHGLRGDDIYNKWAYGSTVELKKPDL